MLLHLRPDIFLEISYVLHSTLHFSTDRALLKTYRKCNVSRSPAWTYEAAMQRKVAINRRSQPLSCHESLHLLSCAVPLAVAMGVSFDISRSASQYKRNYQANPIILISEIQPADTRNNVSESGRLPSIAYVSSFSYKLFP